MPCPRTPDMAIYSIPLFFLQTVYTHTEDTPTPLSHPHTHRQATTTPHTYTEAMSTPLSFLQTATIHTEVSTPLSHPHTRHTHTHATLTLHCTHTHTHTCPVLLHSYPYTASLARKGSRSGPRLLACICVLLTS